MVYTGDSNKMIDRKTAHFELLVQEIYFRLEKKKKSKSRRGGGDDVSALVDPHIKIQLRCLNFYSASLAKINKFLTCL